MPNSKKKKPKPVYKAAYGSATLSDVTRAVLAYRPVGEKPEQPKKARA